MFRVFLVCLVLTVALSDSGSLRSAEPAGGTKQGGETEYLPGMIPTPRPATGKPRWQLVPINTRGEVWACEYSPDGKWLAFNDGPHVRIIDANSYELKRILVGHRGRVIQIAWSPDSLLLATAGNDTTVRLWTVAGVPQFVFREHRHPVRGVAWRPDGKQVLSADQDGKVCLWGLDGRIAKVIPQEAAVFSVAWKPDGSQFATGDENRAIRLWKPDGTELQKLEAHHGRVNGIAWSPDGKFIASCCHGTELDNGNELDTALLCLWKEDGSLVASVPKYTRPLFHVAWRPDSERLAVGAYGTRLRYWDTAGEEQAGAINATRAIHPTWRPGGQRIAAGCFLIDEYYMARDASGAAVSVWNPQTGSVDRIIPRLATGLCGAALSHDGKQIAVGAEDGTVATFSADGKPGRWRKESSRVSGLGWSRDGQGLYLSGASVPVGFSKAADQSALETLPQATGLWTINVNPVDDRVAGITIRDAQIWSADRSQTRTIATSHEHGANCIRWSRDGRRLATGSFDSSVRIFEADGTAGPVLQDSGASTRCVDWSPDGKRLVSGRENHTAKIWSATGKEEQTLEGHDWYVQSVAWSPDGKQIATGSWDSTVRLWNDRGEYPSTFWGHEGSVFALAWLPDSKAVISAAEDGTLRKWDVATGKTDWVAFIQPEGKSATFSAEGKLLHGNAADLNVELLGLSERPDGSMEIVSYAELRKRFE